MFEGKSRYEVKPARDGTNALFASSRGTSSAIFREVNIPISERPILSWEWRAAKFPSRKKNQVLADKSDNDYAARVYVVFGKNNPWMSDMIQYVWDDYFPKGSHGQSPYSNRVKILVVEHGKKGADEWKKERRDLVQDYEMLFGKHPHHPVRAVALMSDSDNTHTDSEAVFRWIRLEKSPS